jgi:DnaJ-class molecular chaperone
MIPVEGGIQAVTVLITSESWAPRWGDDGYPVGDLAKDVKVSPFTMMTGGWINIQTIESERKVYIAPGFQANHWVKVAQAGYWKDTESLERGDAYLRIIPDIKELKEYSRDELNDFIKLAKTASWPADRL